MNGWYPKMVKINVKALWNRLLRTLDTVRRRLLTIKNRIRKYNGRLSSA